MVAVPPGTTSLSVVVTIAYTLPVGSDVMEYALSKLEEVLIRTSHSDPVVFPYWFSLITIASYKTFASLTLLNCAFTALNDR